VQPSVRGQHSATLRGMYGYGARHALRMTFLFINCACLLCFGPWCVCLFRGRVCAIVFDGLRGWHMRVRCFCRTFLLLRQPLHARELNSGAVDARLPSSVGTYAAATPRPHGSWSFLRCVLRPSKLCLDCSARGEPRRKNAYWFGRSQSVGLLIIVRSAVGRPHSREAGQNGHHPEVERASSEGQTGAILMSNGRRPELNRRHPEVEWVPS
jgi:hypothetical protein